MKLYIMKSDALSFLKQNLPDLYGKYYTETTNKWIADIYGENPFEAYKDIPTFNLESLDAKLTPGEIDVSNCKIVYQNLQFLSESQASDERLWAGLTHTTFYEYTRRRWGYGYGKRPQSAEKESSEIASRFLYRGSGRSGFYRNTLAKCWWVGHNTYNPTNKKNPFENLDIIGYNDINSKISEFFYNFTFSSNPYVMSAIIEALRIYKTEGKQLLARDHIRPALSYLNAVGGSVIIDCLKKEEITELFCNAINAIMQGDTPSIRINESEATEENDDDDTDYTTTDTSTNNERQVTLGCKIIIRNASGQFATYKYDYINGHFPESLYIFKNHKEGDIIEKNNEKWTLESITI